MRTMVFRSIFLRDIHYRVTIGMGNVCLIFLFLCEPWPYELVKFQKYGTVQYITVVYPYP